MKKINDIIYLTSQKNYPYINSFFDENCLFFIENIEKEAKVNNALLKNYKEQILYDYICNKISKKIKDTSIQGIIISYNLGNKNAFYLSHHIKLNKDIQNIPLIITHHEPISISSENYYNVNDYGLFKNNAAQFKLFYEIFPDTTKLYNVIKRYQFDYNIYLHNLKIPQPDTTTRHQIANEWGAYKLAHEAGFDISYNIPQTLYFKFLKAKYSGNDDNNRKNNNTDTEKEKTIFDKKLNVLLIDDNYDKGWKEALEKILPAEVSFKEDKLTTSIEIKDRENKKNKENLTFNPKDFDIIFLDIYLPLHKGATTESTSKYAKRILKAIKKENPAVPVIIFTASNKVWNLQELTELGADGYFVKEAPENANIPGFSKRNYDEFVKTVKNSYEKGQLLKAYWNAILEINDNLLPEIQDYQNLKFKSRIEERFKMFFGLLKRGFEQTEFNKKLFYFSDYELAYMTLWSILNEIQEAYYEKIAYSNSITIIDSNGNSYSKHPNGKDIIPAVFMKEKKWVIKNQQKDALIDYSFKIKLDDNNNPKVLNNLNYKVNYELTSYIDYKHNQPPHYFYHTNKTNNPSKQLANQIAFLILAKNQLKNHPRKDVFLTNLKKLNDIRNHLYLTHGDDISSDFYTYTEEGKRKEENYQITPKENIKDLFELVGFLLTGKEITIEI